MSCNSRRTRAFKALGGTERVTGLLGDAGPGLLRDAYVNGRASGAAGLPEDELVLARDRTGALMARMNFATGEVPAHGTPDPKFGVPVPRSPDAWVGYARSHDVLDQIEGRAPMGPEVRLAAARARYGADAVEPMDMPLNLETQKALGYLRAAGLRPLIAGGAVRDARLGEDPKDIDIEVYGGSADAVVRALARVGKVDEVGKSFGVLKVALRDGTDLDVSLPRADSKVGEGHKGIEVRVDPDMTTREATSRRDLTINSMLYDDELKVLVDHHGGREDLEARRIRHVSAAFDEDPLRVLRAARFASRYNGMLDPSTAVRCRALSDSYRELPEERIQGEWDKLVRGQRPSAGVTALRDMGWAGHTPELSNADGLSADRASVIARRDGLNAEGRARSVYTALCAPMGEQGAKSFLSRIGETRMRDNTVDRVIAVVREKDAHRTGDLSSDPQVRALARRLHPANIGDWARHQEATGDSAGRAWHARAVALGVDSAPEPPMVQGRDVLPRLLKGVKPGPWLGKMIADAAEAQETGVFRDTAGAGAWVQARLAADGRS